METFTLVVYLWLEPWSWDYREARTPGLSWDECMAAAKLVQPPMGRARCFLEGAPAAGLDQAAGRRSNRALRCLRRDPGKEADLMETFTLIVWLWTGQRFEENRMLDLGQEECIVRLNVIERGRHTWNFQAAEAKGQCVGAHGSVWPTTREIYRSPLCANVGCGWDLPPGRRRI